MQAKAAQEETVLKPCRSAYLALSIFTFPCLVAGIGVLAQCGHLSLRDMMSALFVAMVWPGLMLWLWGYRLVIRGSTVTFKRLLLPDLVISVHELTGLRWIMLTKRSPWPYRLLVRRGVDGATETCLINVKLFSIDDIQTLMQALNPRGLEVEKIVRRGV